MFVNVPPKKRLDIHLTQKEVKSGWSAQQLLKELKRKSFFATVSARII